MTVDRWLCKDCLETLKESKLVYKKVPGTDDFNKCEWCKSRRLIAAYRIKYGREGKKWTA